MTESYVGTGGWAYLHTPSTDKLKAYAEYFNFVEVNSTFYSFPTVQVATSWKGRVPKSFLFSIKCNRELTHELQFEPVERSFLVFERMKVYCRILGTDLLVFQTPPSLTLTDHTLQKIENFFSAINRDNLELWWEIRGSQGISQYVVALMERQDISHVADLSTEKPVRVSDTVYTRLFGNRPRPIRSFSDEHLRSIRKVAESYGAKRRVYTLHSLRMYEDANRLARMLEVSRTSKYQFTET